MKKIFFLTTFFLLLTTYSFSQTVYEPISHDDIYKFLDRMAQKGLIVFKDNIRPVSRKYIAERLNQIKIQNSKFKIQNLTELEREELEFYLKDYGMESSEFKVQGSKFDENSTFNIQHSTLAGKDQYDRWRLFSYSSDLLKVNVSPILGIEMGKNDGAKQTHTWNGVSLYGYLTDKIGFSFNFRDNDESGDKIDRAKRFTPQTGGVVNKSSNNSIQYSEVHANISTDWSWGEVTIGKDFLNWGYGESGLLVLSDKAPSFPFIRLDLHPTKWLRFNYIHAWLSSDVIDSVASYPTYRAGVTRDVFRNKYLASHTLTLTPLKGLDVSLGESIVYSDKLEISYLMPIMFFRLADHYLSNGNNDAGSNSQFFLGVSSRNHIKNTHLYGTWFIDEFTLSGVFDSQKRRNQFGFTLGASVTDLPIDNMTLTAEYTRINPFVYSHYIPTQTYESSSYLMGHWMGYNADLIYGSLNYRFMRGLQATVWAEHIRKGGAGIVDQQYQQPQPPFLFGLRTNYTYLGFDVKYEIMHELFLRGKYQSSLISAEQANGSFVDTRTSQFLASIYYGL
ncbi:MAG TPA: capsule assembly Wzi family protein [Ignavibacteriaceae bacterium]|nr:capsule assembly Wzi family protein [Ignavibacteriaceae bacterium]